jgi:hypothetical protein
VVLVAEALVKTLRRLFVNRSDTYCVQHKQGYSRVPEPLTDNVLLAHLAGETTVGSYQLNENNQVKWLCWDLDPEKLRFPEATARQILATLFKTKRNKEGEKQPRVWRHAVVLEASRFPNPSYHVWVLFLVPVQAKVAQWLGFRILKLANLNPKKVEVFPKQSLITPERPFGNFVKLPLGKHQTADKWSNLLDFDTFEPMSNAQLLEVVGCSFSQKDLSKILAFKKETSVQSKFALPETFKPLSDKQQEKAIKFLCCYWKEGYRNQLTMYYCGLALKQGVSLESAKRVIREVTARTGDPEALSRLKLVEYHYRTRQTGPLKGASGIAEIIGEAEPDE